MKKFITLLCLLFIANTAYGFEDIQAPDDTLKPEVETTSVEQAVQEVKFDWLDLTQEQRVENANYYKNMILNDESKIRMSKTEFNSQLAKYKKDKNFKHHYMLTNNGVVDDEEAKYNPFYYRKGTLIVYAIQYKNDIHKSLYYTPYGKLYYVDLTSNNYPQFPYYSVQYNRKGIIQSSIYFISRDIQYMYDKNDEFSGVWYKDKLYDLSGKQISTRKGW